MLASQTCQPVFVFAAPICRNKAHEADPAQPWRPLHGMGAFCERLALDVLLDSLGRCSPLHAFKTCEKWSTHASIETDSRRTWNCTPRVAAATTKTKPPNRKCRGFIGIYRTDRARIASL